MEPKTGKVFDGNNLRAEWEKACTACGLGRRELVEGPRFVRRDCKHPRQVKNTWHRYNGLIVHDLRRSAIRNLIRAGVSEQVAMRISGHKTVSVFRRYNIAATDDVTSAMHRLESATVAGKTMLTGKRFSAKLVQIRGRRSAKATKTR